MLGYALAYSLDRENSGLVYAQYDSKIPLNSVVTLIDKLGISRTTPIDDYVFVIQSTVIQTRVELTTLLKQGNVARAKERIKQLYELYLSEYSKSLLDHDHNAIDNTGFIGEKAIRHDVGKVAFDESISLPENYTEDWRKIAWERIDPWMESHFPQYRAEIAQELIN